MKIIDAAGREDIALVYIADMGGGRLVEFVESIQPPLPREKKWVLIVSTLAGCPVGCLMCDAGGEYRGPLSPGEIFAQIDYLIGKRYPDRRVPVEKFKIQFSRMGDPSLNPAVLDVLDVLPGRYHVPGLLPSLSTVAPRGTEGFFKRLAEIKRRRYGNGCFQLQFSIHTTDPGLREKIIPVKKWSFPEIAAYGARFRDEGDRKVTLNFALAGDVPLDPRVLIHHFSPDDFLVKITPLNPTHRAEKHRLSSYIDAHGETGEYPVINGLQREGYEVILSVGETEENRIGSNCGQYVMRHLQERDENVTESGGYGYWRHAGRQVNG